MLIQDKKQQWTPDNSFLLEYRERIETGEIIAGWELRDELTNLKGDFEDDLYFYDTTEAKLRMDFMQKCVRLTKSPFYNKPMVLMLWQKALIEAIYSFKMAKESAERGMAIRRFHKVLLMIGRKNAKSETSSAIGLSEFICGAAGAEITCASNDERQSSIVYDAVDTMRRLIDPRDLDTKRNQSYILNKATNTKIYKLSERTENKEGRNIDFAVIDEIHEMREGAIVKPIEQSQSTKDNPLIIEITTEGFTVDGYLDAELNAARRIIKGEDDTISGRRMLPWLYTQDSESEVFQNPESWYKSNPALGVVKKKAYLEEQIDLAKKSKADRKFVLSKDFNIKQASVEAWLNLEDYTYKAGYDLEEFRGCACLGAVDLSETTDLTNLKILLMRPDDKTKYIHSVYFIPQTKLQEDKNAGAKYEEWTKEGHMIVSEGNDIDLTIVADYFYTLYKRYEIKLFVCGYDQKFAKAFLKRMEDYGWAKASGELDLILQNAETLSNAMKLCEADLKARLINYGENPVDRWCLGNAAIKVDDRGRCLCVKQEAHKRIDGAVTLVILYEVYRRYRSEFAKIVDRGKK